jgi:leukotriene-A4 hydrolase
VAGNLEERSVSQRCAVISEPEALERAALELEDLESYVHTIEEYTRIPYLWKAYKIVVLPASFPYGGMENPLLTFASPTIIVGDKSQTGVAIHEIAHSWSGNLVSCKNWECFWLNEGWTVFLELKAIRTLRG